jgi:hypothetical protein
LVCLSEKVLLSMGQSHDPEVGFKEKNLTFFVKSYVLHRRSSDVLQQGGHFLENKPMLILYRSLSTLWHNITKYWRLSDKYLIKFVIFDTLWLLVTTVLESGQYVPTNLPVTSETF